MKLKINALLLLWLSSSSAFSAFTVQVKPNASGTMPLLTWSQADQGCLRQLLAQGCPGASSPTGSCTSPSFMRFYGSSCNQISLTFQMGTAPCNLTQAEVFFERQYGTQNYSTTYDVSLVNGFGGPVSVTPNSGKAVTVLTVNGAVDMPGAYPYACDLCTSRGAPPPCAPYPTGCSTAPNPPLCQWTQKPGISSMIVNFNP
jgi:hypothetical protein